MDTLSWDVYEDDSDEFDVASVRTAGGIELTCVFERESDFPFFVLRSSPAVFRAEDGNGLESGVYTDLRLINTAPALFGDPDGFLFSDILSIAVSPDSGRTSFRRFIVNDSELFEEDVPVPAPMLVVDSEEPPILYSRTRQMKRPEPLGADPSKWPAEIRELIDIRR